jgi:hypothetical protein
LNLFEFIQILFCLAVPKSKDIDTAETKARLIHLPHRFVPILWHAESDASYRVVEVEFFNVSQVDEKHCNAANQQISSSTALEGRQCFFNRGILQDCQRRQ